MTLGAPGLFAFSLPVLPMLDAATSRALGASPAPELTSEPSATAVSASHSSPARDSDCAARLHHWVWSLNIRMRSCLQANIEADSLTPNTLTISLDAPSFDSDAPRGENAGNSAVLGGLARWHSGCTL